MSVLPSGSRNQNNGGAPSPKRLTSDDHALARYALQPGQGRERLPRCLMRVAHFGVDWRVRADRGSRSSLIRHEPFQRQPGHVVRPLNVHEVPPRRAGSPLLSRRPGRFGRRRTGSAGCSRRRRRPAPAWAATRWPQWSRPREPAPVVQPGVEVAAVDPQRVGRQPGDLVERAFERRPRDALTPVLLVDVDAGDPPVWRWRGVLVVLALVLDAGKFFGAAVLAPALCGAIRVDDERGVGPASADAILFGRAMADPHPLHRALEVVAHAPAAENPVVALGKLGPCGCVEGADCAPRYPSSRG